MWPFQPVAGRRGLVRWPVFLVLASVGGTTRVSVVARHSRDGCEPDESGSIYFTQFGRTSRDEAGPERNKPGSAVSPLLVGWSSTFRLHSCQNGSRCRP